MDEEVVRPADLDFVVALVNEYATAARASAGEGAEPYPDLTRLAGAASSVVAYARALDTSTAVPGLVDLADGLHLIFASAQPRPRNALQALNLLLRDSLALPHLSQSGDVTVADWRLLPVPSRANKPIRALKAACALALHQWLSSGGSLHRLGVCGAHRCVDVFLDGTQAGSRRYCSPSCANRTKVAAHRARRRSWTALAMPPDRER